MPSQIWTAALYGVNAILVTVEADSGGGDFGQISIVGLPDAAVSEAKERVKSSLRCSGLEFPRRKITVNLAPADFKKRGPAYDLPIALSILCLKNKIQNQLSDSLVAGELALNGEVRPVAGVLAMALAARQAGFKKIFIPAANADEARLIPKLQVFPVYTLRQLIEHLEGRAYIPPASALAWPPPEKSSASWPDWQDINGQLKAKRALEIAAAGHHHLIMSGPPGAGKSLLAKSLAGLLPRPSYEESLEITKIYSAAGLLTQGLILERPWRAPHHSASRAALVGGGSQPRPGEISLAHRGILFLDELPEFSRSSLESLRQPLENGYMEINRALSSLHFPAKFLLIAAMNPCPCGYRGDAKQTCSCRAGQIQSYRHKISGPLLDRFDLQVTVARVKSSDLGFKDKNIMPSSDISRLKVARARQIQITRLRGSGCLSNADMDNALIKKYCPLDSDTDSLLTQASETLNLSARAYWRILKLARTIADLEAKTTIAAHHLAEALEYRPRLK